MPAQILVTAEPFGILVVVSGLPDASAVNRAAEAFTATSSAAGGVIVDLRDAVLVPPGPVLALIAALRTRTPGRPMTLACDRLSGRRLLRAGCRHLNVAVVDALPTGLVAGVVEPASPVPPARAAATFESWSRPERT